MTGEARQRGRGVPQSLGHSWPLYRTGTHPRSFFGGDVISDCGCGMAVLAEAREAALSRWGGAVSRGAPPVCWRASGGRSRAFRGRFPASEFGASPEGIL